MSFEATISRKKALDAATKAVDLANTLTQRHNETIEEVGRVRLGLQTIEAQGTKRLDAQRAMIEGVEKSIARLEKLIAENHHHVVKTLADEQRHYVDTQDKALRASIDNETTASDRYIDAVARCYLTFVQMGFIARLRWLFTGNIPDFGPGMVPEETSGRVHPAGGGHAGISRHETPRPIQHGGLQHP